LVQEHLSSLYRQFFRSAAISDTLAARLSCPLLLAVGRRWQSAERRVLFVGQETFGWDWKHGDYYAWPHPPLATLADFRRYDRGVEALVNGYSAFKFSRHQPRNLNGPFWRAFQLLLEGISVTAPPTCCGRTCFAATSMVVPRSAAAVPMSFGRFCHSNTAC
jgi:hypothetical protein